MARLLLTADCGGTNARLGVSEVGAAPEAFLASQTYQWDQVESLEQAITLFLSGLELAPSAIDIAVVAVAGPVVPGRDCFNFTNVDRPIAVSALGAFLQTKRVFLINDFVAQASALSVLGKAPNANLTPLSAGTANPQGACAVLGAGTGLGVAGLVPATASPQLIGSAPFVFPGEGGNVALGARVESIRQFLPDFVEALRLYRLGHPHPDKRVTPRYEDMLSGTGLSLNYAGLCIRDGVDVTFPKPAQVSALAHQDGDPRACEAFALFFDCLAQASADFALQYLAVGGVYIAGGVVPKNLELLDRARFDTVFSDTWGFEPLLAEIPVWAVTSAVSGLVGAAVFGQGLPD